MTKFFALLMLVNGAGLIIVSLIGGQLLRFTSWQCVIIVLFGVGMILLFTVLFSLRETLPIHKRSRGGIAHTLATFESLLKDWVLVMRCRRADQLFLDSTKQGEIGSQCCGISWRLVFNYSNLNIITNIGI